MGSNISNPIVDYDEDKRSYLRAFPMSPVNVEAIVMFVIGLVVLGFLIFFLIGTDSLDQEVKFYERTLNLPKNQKVDDNYIAIMVLSGVGALGVVIFLIIWFILSTQHLHKFYASLGPHIDANPSLAGYFDNYYRPGYFGPSVQYMNNLRPVRLTTSTEFGRD